MSGQSQATRKPINSDAAGFSAERLSRINSLMNRYVESGKLAGVVTCVERRGHLAHFETFGCQNLETQTAMAWDSIFRIYSMT